MPGQGYLASYLRHDSSLSCPTSGVGLGALSGSVVRAGVIWGRSDLGLGPDDFCEACVVDHPHFSLLERKACLTVLQILERETPSPAAEASSSSWPGGGDAVL